MVMIHNPHQQPHQPQQASSSYYYYYSNITTTTTTTPSIRTITTATTTNANRKKNKKTASNTSATGTITTSSREQFKQIPVPPSILQYIERIGVGIPKRNKHPNRKIKLGKSRGRQQLSASNNTTLTTTDNNILSLIEEKRLLSMQQQQQRRRRQQQPRPKKQQRSNSTSGIPRNHSTTDPPPPPFGTGGKSYSRKDNHDDADDIAEEETSSSTTTTSSSRSYRLLPVKLLKRVGIASTTNADTDCDNEFPYPSPNLPEVAIIGRSNVGKSTLLNALLYGGGGRINRHHEDDEDEDYGDDGMTTAAATSSTIKRRRKKTKTSQTAKIPRGIKAVTSSKPGETKTIDFYQVSSYSQHDDQQSNQETNLDDITGSKRKMISLLLVDLPGYGFAYGPSNLSSSTPPPPSSSEAASASDGRQSKLGENVSPETPIFPWQNLIESYILDRPRSSLKRILLLIDARHGMKRSDFDFLESLQTSMKRKKQQMDDDEQRQQQQQQQQGLSTKRISSLRPSDLPPIQVVLTKCDLVPQVDLARRVLLVRQQLSDCLRRQSGALPEMLVSAEMEGRAGCIELQRELASLCGHDKNKDSIHRSTRVHQRGQDNHYNHTKRGDRA
jgi:GTP-binding protein